MQIWVDADACPRTIKEILFRAAERMRVPMILVANTLLRTPPSPFIRAMRVPRGFDVADREIVEQVQAGDLVVTADIPLAAEVIGRGASALDPRGVLYTEDNVPERLAVRNLMDQLRASGLEAGRARAVDPGRQPRVRESAGPAPLGTRKGRPGSRLNPAERN